MYTHTSLLASIFVGSRCTLLVTTTSSHVNPCPKAVFCSDRTPRLPASGRGVGAVRLRRSAEQHKTASTRRRKRKTREMASTSFLLSKQRVFGPRAGAREPGGKPISPTPDRADGCAEALTQTSPFRRQLWPRGRTPRVDEEAEAAASREGLLLPSIQAKQFSNYATRTTPASTTGCAESGPRGGGGGRAYRTATSEAVVGARSSRASEHSMVSRRSLSGMSRPGYLTHDNDRRRRHYTAINTLKGALCSAKTKRR
ncbi:unnamed protein product [Protopolystoma xenopodis]|uniref:Uncharacterized protein n=1 Tax=Protopolystoma xenopodis TaxID=117903 RepID=A0A448XIL1_9PLAT|nr:unnamed protein product [Protopolystoma xenopodis]